MKKLATWYLFAVMMLNIVLSWIVAGFLWFAHDAYSRVWPSEPVTSLHPDLLNFIWWPYVFAFIAGAGCITGLLAKKTPFLIHLVILLLTLDIYFGLKTLYIHLSPFVSFADMMRQ